MTRAFAALVLLLAAPDAGRPAPTVEGPGGRTLTLDPVTLTRLGRVEEEWTSRGATRRVSGVPLQKILAEVGVEPGAMGKDLEPGKKRLGLRQAVVVIARDGFRRCSASASSGPGWARRGSWWSIEWTDSPWTRRTVHTGWWS